jgi:uncharacterized protein YprB with RNaseH-like and TPR domain
VEAQTNEAYVDIETTGLNFHDAEIVVLGLNRVGAAAGLVQLVGSVITCSNVLDALVGVEVLYTLSGTRFDLPMIEETLGVSFARRFIHRDLLHDCHRHGLYGGLSAIEVNLGIVRQLRGLKKSDAATLWNRYRERKDPIALSLLMQFNKENVMSLKILRDKLCGAWNPGV